jgi:hypothetical protein
MLLASTCFKCVSLSPWKRLLVTAQSRGSNIARTAGKIIVICPSTGCLSGAACLRTLYCAAIFRTSLHRLLGWPKDKVPYDDNILDTSNCTEPTDKKNMRSTLGICQRASGLTLGHMRNRVLSASEHCARC